MKDKRIGAARCPAGRIAIAVDSADNCDSITRVLCLLEGVRVWAPSHRWCSG